MFWNKKNEDENKIETERSNEDEVAVTQKEAEAAKGILQNLLNTMEFITSVAIDEIDKQNNIIHLDITGDDLGKVIGRDGATLDALQYLIRIMVSRELGYRIKIKLDSNGYRQKKEETLIRYAKSAINSVKSTGKEIILEPMNPSERRQVHLVAAEIDGVETNSQGEGKERRVVISPV